MRPRARTLALLLPLLLGGCAYRCRTVAVIPDEFVVLSCPHSGARNGIVVVRWSELVGPWPTAP
jgi:hypothetical protein